LLVAGDKAKLDAALQPATGLALDQSTPQIVDNGAPTFRNGIITGPVVLDTNRLRASPLGGIEAVEANSGSLVPLRCAEPIEDFHVASKFYVQNRLNEIGLKQVMQNNADADMRRIGNLAGPSADDDADTQGARNAAIAAAVAYTPGNASHWASPVPATLAEAIDRLAAAVSNNGANPV
jgi:hypothetical protein